jgi:drug/metabolite transporter (DMT)-like permease
VTGDRADATDAGRFGDDPTDHDPVHHDPGETSHLMLIALILFSVALAAVAQLTLKRGMDQVAAGTGVLRFGADSLRDVVTTPAVWVGLALFGLSAVAWLAVLSRASLSFAYPFASLTYVLILLADRFLLEQEVPALRYAGVAFIVVGIVLVAQTRHA